MMLDRIVGVGITTHEGQLFGPFNQLLGLMAALGLNLLSISAVVLWWRRRSVGVLGAPVPAGRPRAGFALGAAIVGLAISMPALAISLLVVAIVERFILTRIPAARQWLGLAAA
jgi:uncharacterized iron-regulated membrane protein